MRRGSTGRTGLWVAVVVTALAGTVATAHAQTPGKTGPTAADIDKARKHYNAAEKAASELRWKDAARDYGVAYEITKDPVMFFKLGNAYDKDGNCTEALAYYKRYLAEGKPAKEFVDITNERVKACEEKVAAGTGNTGTGNTGTGNTGTGNTGTGTGTGGTGTEAGTGTGTGGTETGTGAGTTGSIGTEDPFEESPPIPKEATSPLADEPAQVDPTWQRTAAWISVGAAVAFGVTGTVLGLAASSREDDIQADINFRDTNDVPARFEGTAAERYDDLVDQGKNLELASFITFGAAGAAVALATVFFVIDPGHPTAESSSRAFHIGPTASPDSVGVSAGWSF